jgi:hypothetical protein
MPDDEPPQTTISGRTFTFTTSAQAAVDARRLVNARANRTHLLVDSLFLFVGGALIVAGQWIGVPIAIVAATLLTASQLQVVQRWMVGRNAGSLMGRRTDVTFDATGIRMVGELGSSDVPWSVLTSVRADERTVIFVRGSVLAAYLPATSFAGPDEQRALVRFADERLTEAIHAHEAD